jgi:cell fate (sporulation/competence/biofilm development) regulator YmcA (YheA/YmcA/DUF963 family)
MRTRTKEQETKKITKYKVAENQSKPVLNSFNILRRIKKQQKAAITERT